VSCGVRFRPKANSTAYVAFRPLPSERPCGDVQLKQAGDWMTAEPHRALRLLFVVGLLGCLSCSPPKQTIPKQATAQPQRAQVSFFERPATLAAVRESGEAVPALVLMETDPWAAVLGSDSPTFVLYEDGTAIWRTASGFRTTRLRPSEVEQLYAKLRPATMQPYYGGYSADDATDQPEEDFLIYRGESPTFISVYGRLEAADVRAKVPAEIVRAYDVLKGFNPSQSTEWMPDKIEVMVWPYEYAPEPSIEWPTDLPDLKDPGTVRRGDSFSIFIPSSKLHEVRTLLGRRNEKGAIEIDGKKWAASVRFPFPSERLWMAPNPELKAPKT
jgi:hypothetical protein